MYDFYIHLYIFLYNFKKQSPVAGQLGRNVAFLFLSFGEGHGLTQLESNKASKPMQNSSSLFTNSIVLVHYA